MEHEVTVQELKRLLNEDPDLLVLDCREPAELRLASLEGALHIPMNEIPDRVGELDPTRATVVLCHHGVRSLRVVHWLRERGGFNQVKSLAGGIEAWALLVDPTVSRY